MMLRAVREWTNTMPLDTPLAHDYFDPREVYAVVESIRHAQVTSMTEVLVVWLYERLQEAKSV
jgi:hypothetical protein